MLMLDPDVPQEMFVELYAYLANSAFRTNRSEQARRFLYEGLALDPDDEELRQIASEILPKDENDLLTK